MGKIIHLPQAAKATLSISMIKTLKAAYEKQKHNKPIGQSDLDGSFTTLVKRNLIAARTSLVNNETVVTWYLTRAAIDAITKPGIRNID